MTAAAPGRLRTLVVLLRAAARRSANRSRHKRAQRRKRSGRAGGNWGIGGILLAVGALVVLEAILAGSMVDVLNMATRTDAPPLALIRPLHVSTDFLLSLRQLETFNSDHRVDRVGLRYIHPSVQTEAARIARERGGDTNRIAARLMRVALTDGAAGFTDLPQPTVNDGKQPLADLALTIMIALWLLMLIGGGEDSSFDGQSRRQPMWEWLFSHPVPPAAVFLAESLAPIAANPVVAAAPLVPAALYGWAYGLPAGVLAFFTVGIPVAIAAACFGKAVEFAIMLRCTPRTRGAALALKSGLGISMLGLLFFGLNAGAAVFVRTLAPLAPAWPIPTLGILLGRYPGHASMALGMLTCFGISALVVAASLRFTMWSAGAGLLGAPAARSRVRRRGAGFRRWPLLRKELLWLARDRGAIVQIVLLPITFASFNLLQASYLAAAAPLSWNMLCGGGIVLGGLFLTYLGPRALASDGAALWIALSWPLDLERLLRLKAALWTALAAILTFTVFAFAVWRSPADAWHIALLAPVALAFIWSVALKASTLATVVSGSGEPEPIPLGRRWATQLGGLAFAIGVSSGRWSQATLGLIYSVIAAAALWESFRGRLPFLLDPWSERAPRPPTIIHALVAIGLLTDLAVSLAALFGMLGGPAVYVLAYAAAAAVVGIGTAGFLSNRDVGFAEISRPDPAPFGRSCTRFPPGSPSAPPSAALLSSTRLSFRRAPPRTATSSSPTSCLAFASPRSPRSSCSAACSTAASTVRRCSAVGAAGPPWSAVLPCSRPTTRCAPGPPSLPSACSPRCCSAAPPGSRARWPRTSPTMPSSPPRC